MNHTPKFLLVVLVPIFGVIVLALAGGGAKGDISREEFESIRVALTRPPA